MTVWIRVVLAGAALVVLGCSGMGNEAPPAGYRWVEEHWDNEESFWDLVPVAPAAGEPRACEPQGARSPGAQGPGAQGPGAMRPPPPPPPPPRQAPPPPPPPPPPLDSLPPR